MRDRLRRHRHDLGYLALRGFLAAARPFPLRVVRGLGVAAGRLASLLARRDRERALAHLQLAFPDHDVAWRTATLRASATHLGSLLGEVAWLWSVPPAQLLAHTEMVGLEHLRDARGERLGAILVTGHCGNWEWMNLALGASGLPMSVAAREVYDPRLDGVAQQLRGRFGGDTVLRGPEAGGRLVRALRRGRVMGILIDQDIDAPGTFVEFFGQPAWTPVGAALLALRTGAPVVPGFAARLPDGRMQVRFEPPVPHPDGPDLETRAALLTATLTSRIEAQIRHHPSQWVWMHRRWKRRPEPGDRVWTPAQPSPASA
ncbi:MAG: lysophospholipid acyltransferase family protein [Thermoanaerobaculaceae bacterium]|jgi:KDO2-lipid IV(A) lauroyltransferase|nr:lysophospholipid acyltransferase family protein [Thermoanaerobaculaceae bacterium]